MSAESALRLLLGHLGREAPEGSHANRNLARDVSVLTRRLCAGEYARTDFEERNPFDIPRRTREFFLYMNGYLQHAQKWYEILRVLPLNECSHVVDLCPGWAPKIELALLRLEFAGTVLVIDKDPDATDALQLLLSGFAPKFVTRVVNADFWQPIAQVQKTPLLLASHVIDDLLLSRFSPGYSSLIYEHEAVFSAAWQHVAANLTDDKIEDFGREFAVNMLSLCAEKCDVVLSHYPSFIDEKIGNAALARIADTFAAVQRALRDLGFRFHAEPLPGYVHWQRDDTGDAVPSSW